MAQRTPDDDGTVTLNLAPTDEGLVNRPDTSPRESIERCRPRHREGPILPTRVSACCDVPGLSADPATASSIGRQRETIATLRSVYNVVLVVNTPIEAVERHSGPWASATKVSADITRVEMNIPDLGWAVLMLAVLNTDILYVEPPEFLTYL